MAKKAKAPAVQCSGGGPHYWHLTTEHDAQHRIGDRHVCVRCRAEKFVPWPTAKESQWTSLRRKVA